MRVHVTRRKLKENYYCIAVGYCQLQNLLNYSRSPYYTADMYGWNFDTYTFEYKGCNIAICTGYREMPGKSVPYDIKHEFDTRAEKIIHDREENKKERLEFLIQEFIATVYPEL